MSRQAILFLLAAACTTAFPSIHNSRSSLGPRQENGAVAPSVLLRRAYHASAVLNRRVYIDGGEFSYLRGNSPTYQYSNTLVSIDLSQDWTNDSVTLRSTPKPPGVPNLRYGGIWVDRENGRLYTGFAGTTPAFGDAAPSPQGLWSFTPDGSGGGGWKNYNDTADPIFVHQPRPFKGQVASGRGTGFFLGGFVGNGTGGQRPLDAFLTYNFPDNKATTSSARGLGHFGGTAYVPNWGARGILVNAGGHKDGKPDSFQTVQIFDILNQRWFEQDTSGDVPAPRQDFCIAGAPSSNRTHEILVYAGCQPNGKLGSAAIPYDSAYVLTLPAFRWVKADYKAARPRHGLSCNAVGGGQILIIGGVDSTQEGDESADGGYRAGFDTPDPFKQGLAIFDLSQLAWKPGYTASQALQPPAPKIQAYYNTKGRKPASGFSSADLEALFAAGDFSPDRGSDWTTPSASDHSRAGDIAGGVVGGLAGLAAVAALVVGCRRWGRRRPQELQSAGGGDGGDGAGGDGSGGKHKDGGEGSGTRFGSGSNQGADGRAEMEGQGVRAELPGDCTWPTELPGRTR